MHQSYPGVRRLRVSQPSIHFPLSVYLPSIKTGFACFNKFSLGAKNSSFASTARPPSRSDAKSTNCVNSFIPRLDAAHAPAAPRKIPRDQISSARVKMSSLRVPKARAPHRASLYAGDAAAPAARKISPPRPRSQNQHRNPPRSFLFFPQVRPAAPAPRTTTAQDASQHSRAHVPPSIQPVSSAARKRFRPKRAKNPPPPAASSPADRANDRSPRNRVSCRPAPATIFRDSPARESVAHI